jgi:hypothetical protein
MANADNKLKGAQKISGLGAAPRSWAGKVGLTDRDNLYSFVLKQPKSFNLALTKLSKAKGSVAVEIYAAKRPLKQVLRQIGNLDFRKIRRSDRQANLQLLPLQGQTTLAAGHYFLRVLSRTGNSRYRLQVAASPATSIPTASLSATNLAIGGSTTYDFTVTYSDSLGIDVASLDSSDILVTSPNGFNQLASRVAVSNSSNGNPRSATYRITAPGGSWDNADNGSYSVALQANQVKNTGGNFVSPALLGAFQVNITATPIPDREAPTANLFSIDSNRDFTVTYRDNAGINSASISDNDVQVKAPNGALLNTRIIANASTNGIIQTVTYRITPPGGSWDNADNGSYSLTLQANQVSDSSGNFAGTKLLGNLDVNIAPRPAGNRYSVTGTDETFIKAQFNLFSIAPDSTPITDQAASTTVGLFTGAVEDFLSGSGRLENINSPDLVIPFTADNQVSFNVLNLRAELINYNPVAKTGTLEYRFFQKPVTEFQPEVDKTIFGLRFTLNAEFFQNFNPDLAVNSLDYIVTKNLLGDGSGNKLSGIGFSDDPTLIGKDIAGGAVFTPPTT